MSMKVGFSIDNHQLSTIYKTEHAISLRDEDIVVKVNIMAERRIYK